jgi:hypothetical protein
MVQLDLEKNTTRKKTNTCRMMFMLCQWDFSELIEELVRMLLRTSENCSRKFQAWVHFVLSKRRVNKWASSYGEWTVGTLGASFPEDMVSVHAKN